jgi:ABC-type branched-subunit amino acid transport system substrate-binding protein
MKPGLVALALLVLAPGCTGGNAPANPGNGSPQTLAPSASNATGSASPTGVRPIQLDVVASLYQATGGQGAVDDQSYLDGMRLAVQEVNDGDGIDGRPLALRLHDAGDSGTARATMAGILDDGPVAILYVGPGDALARMREPFAQAGTPVILLESDLYTSRGLFPQAFQTTIPWTWQAKVIARYLVKDREPKRIVFVGSGPEAKAAADSTGEWLTYWGGNLAGSFVTGPGAPASPPPFPASMADAVVAFGSASDDHGIMASVMNTARHPRVVASAALLSPVSGFDPLPAGTTACYTYTWAGWAQAIPRVGRFVERFTSAFGRQPAGFEQEGYDAVRALALGLQRDHTKGGGSLVDALETIKDTAFSSFPIDLGPDDHLFLPRDELGLFAVPGPRERLDPWQSRSDPNLWRPVMRTFTYDGQRDNILDRDRPVFFPFWEKGQPGPKYWRSRLGITTTRKDPLH